MESPGTIPSVIVSVLPFSTIFLPPEEDEPEPEPE